MSKNSVPLLMGFLVVILFAQGAAAATWVWEDGDFAEEDWDLVSWYPPLDGGGSDATIAFTIGHGGNPGALRTAGVTLGGGPDDGGMIGQYHALWTWDPATGGPVTEIEGGLDFLSPQATPTRIGLAVQQDGNLFIHVLEPLAADVDWATYTASGLTEADFSPFDPNAGGQPDFSVTGSELRFGFATGQLAAFAGGETGFSHHVDNVTLVMTTGPVSAVGPGARTVLEPPIIQPNPFNPRTEISFEMPAAGFASLRIFDLSGRLVRILEARRFERGPQAVTWRGDDDTGRAAASGVYLAVLETATGRVSQRLTLAR